MGVRCDVGVGVQCEPRGVVTQHGGHRFHVHAVLQGHGCEGVAEVVETDAGQLYVTDDYEIALETLDGGDLNGTLQALSGRTAEELTVLETRTEDGMKRYEFVWACAGEEGDRLGRAVILDDGNYHYCLSVLRPADPERTSQVVWSQVFQSFSLG